MPKYSEGDIVTNPDTGDRMQVQDGKWVSIGPSVGTDIQRTTIPGLIRGGTNLATAPAAALDLAKRGIAKATETLGFQDTADRMRRDIDNPGYKIPGTELSIRPDRSLGFMVDPASAMKQVESMAGGPLYQPQTTPGKFYNAAIEALPGVGVGGGPGGLVNAGKNVVKNIVAALGGEAGGQMAEGSKWEGPARIVGSLVGGQIPSTGRRIVTPAPGDPAHIARAQNVEAQGVKLGAGQYTGSPKLKAFEEFWRPRANNGMTDENQRDAVSRALMRSTGGPDVKPLPQLVQRQQQSLNAERNNIAVNHTVPVDPRYRADLDQIVTDYKMATGLPIHGQYAGGVATPLDPMLARLQPTTGTGRPVTGMLGTRYLNLRNELGNMSRRAPGAERDAYAAMLTALDNAAGRSVGPFGRVNQQIENAENLRRTMQGTTPDIANGIADPARYATLHPNPSSPSATFARDASAVLAPTSMTNQIGHGVHAGAASTVAGALTGMALAKYAPQWGIHDPSIFGLLAGPAVAHTVGMYNPVTAKVMMSDPMQAWLRNQAIRPTYEGAANKLGRATAVNAANTDFWDALERLDQ